VPQGLAGLGEGAAYGVRVPRKIHIGTHAPTIGESSFEQVEEEDCVVDGRSAALRPKERDIDQRAGVAPLKESGAQEMVESCRSGPEDVPITSYVPSSVCHERKQRMSA
jgi:hypothetical protein